MAADRAEDHLFGADRRGDETPQRMHDKEQRLAKIRAVEAELEAEAKTAAAAKAATSQRDPRRALAQASAGPPPTRGAAQFHRFR